MRDVLNFYKNKKIFITGHTGFKGSWLCEILLTIGVPGENITGYSLKPNTNPNLFDICNLNQRISSFIGDIRDLDKLCDVMNKVKPDVVFHLAAQPLVRDSYKNPRYTYETNVMGTVNILESIRNTSNIKSFLNITTDKVYRNNEWCWGYREDEYLDGYDPYSNSKSCSELVTATYKRSFFDDGNVAISTARAGNVIGGGDFAIDRIIPDCARAAAENKDIIIRNPNSIRPYQHVLEPLFAYLLIAKKQYEDISFAGNYNIGPNESDFITTSKLASLFCDCWGENLSWENKSDGGPHEANFLKLDCAKIKNKFGWTPKLNAKQAVIKTALWYKAYFENKDVQSLIEEQIKEYMSIGE